jgi:hypothetical protein
LKGSRLKAQGSSLRAQGSGLKKISVTTVARLDQRDHSRTAEIGMLLPEP